MLANHATQDCALAQETKTQTRAFRLTNVYMKSVNITVHVWKILFNFW